MERSRCFILNKKKIPKPNPFFLKKFLNPTWPWMIEVSQRPWKFNPSLVVSFFFSGQGRGFIDLSLFFFSLSRSYVFKAVSFHHHSRYQAEPGPISTSQKSVRSTSNKGQMWTIKSFCSALQLIQHSLISSTTLTVRARLWIPFFYVWILLLSGVDFALLLIKGRKYYSREKALHLPELITVNFTGNKVLWIHSFMAIDQNGNKWLNFNLLDSCNHSISWYSLLICTTCFPSKCHAKLQRLINWEFIRDSGWSTVEKSQGNIKCHFQHLSWFSVSLCAPVPNKCK